MPTRDPPDSDAEFTDFFLAEPSNEVPPTTLFDSPVPSLNDGRDGAVDQPVPRTQSNSPNAPALQTEIPLAEEPSPSSVVSYTTLESAAGGDFVCPRCLKNVPNFKTGQDSAGGRSYHCPACDREVPLIFVRDFGKHPFTQFSLAGLTGNGKSCFLRGLFHSFNNSQSNDWTEFSYEPLSDIDGKKLEDWLTGIEGGPLPGPSQLQIETVGLRLYGIPGLGTLDLLLFDISGEAFTNVQLLQSQAYHVQRSEVVTLLISLEDIKSNFQLIRLLQDFQLGLSRMGTAADQKTLLVVLTKGDTLLADGTLPEIARNFLSNEMPLEPGDASQLLELSDALRVWMDRHRSNYSGFVRNAGRAFKQVRYTVISALGFAPSGVTQMFAMQPRNIVSPLIWLLHESLPEVWLKTEAGDFRYFSLTEALSAASQVNDSCPTIEIGAGRFRVPERLVLGRTLKLLGQGIGQTFIVGDAPEALVTVNAPVFRAAGISFVRDGVEPGHVVIVSSPLFIIQSCEFQGGIRDTRQNRFGHGLVIKSASRGSRVSLVKNCKATRNACGFHILAQTWVRLETSRSDNNLYGILISGAANAEVVECGFRENTCGIDVNDAGTVALQSNVCEQNVTHGILIRGSSQPQLTDNTCKLNGKDGIAINGAARATVAGNSAVRNKRTGISIQTIAVTTVQDNRCSQNAAHGILLDGIAKATVLGPNTCTQNGTPPNIKKDIVDQRKSERKKGLW